MKNLNCDSGSRISSVFLESCNTIGFPGMASQPGPLAVEAACGSPRPHGNFSSKGLGVGCGGASKDTLLGLVAG